MINLRGEGIENKGTDQRVRVEESALASNREEQLLSERGDWAESREELKAE